MAEAVRFLVRWGIAIAFGQCRARQRPLHCCSRAAARSRPRRALQPHQALLRRSRPAPRARRRSTTLRDEPRISVAPLLDPRLLRPRPPLPPQPARRPPSRRRPASRPALQPRHRQHRPDQPRPAPRPARREPVIPARISRPLTFRPLTFRPARSQHPQSPAPPSTASRWPRFTYPRRTSRRSTCQRSTFRRSTFRGAACEYPAPSSSATRRCAYRDTAQSTRSSPRG